MRAFRIVALLLFAFFVAQTVFNLERGIWHNQLWVSHAVLPLAALGFWYGNVRVLTASLTLILVPHFFWVLDFFLQHTGLPTMGITEYLIGTSFLDYLFTMNHLVLIPLLAWALYKERPEKTAWMISAGYFAIVSLLARLWTNPLYNVNCVFRVCEAHILDIFRVLDTINPVAYWIVLNVLVAILFFIPVNSLLYVLGRKLQ